jgi:hypothetical protein
LPSALTAYRAPKLSTSSSRDFHSDSPKSVLFAFGAFLLISLSPAHALINVDGSRNQLFVFGSVTFGYDSNIFFGCDGSR